MTQKIKSYFNEKLQSPDALRKNKIEVKNQLKLKA